MFCVGGLSGLKAAEAEEAAAVLGLEIQIRELVSGLDNAPLGFNQICQGAADHDDVNNMDAGIDVCIANLEAGLLFPQGQLQRSECVYITDNRLQPGDHVNGFCDVRSGMRAWVHKLTSCASMQILQILQTPWILVGKLVDYAQHRSHATPTRRPKRETIVCNNTHTQAPPPAAVCAEGARRRPGRDNRG